MKISTNNKIGIFAPSGYGKTFLADKIVKSIKNKVIIYDTDYEASTKKYFNYPQVSIFKPSSAKAEDIESLKDFLHIELQEPNKFIYIEDLDLFFDANSQNSKGSALLKYIASKGRHARIGFMYTGKQLAYIPTKLRAMTNLMFIGYYDDRIEKQRIKETIGKNIYDDYYLNLVPNEHEFLMIDSINRDIKVVRV